MDAYGTARLAAKDAESAIVARICEDFNMTPVLARAHFEQMARYFWDFGHMACSRASCVIWRWRQRSRGASRSSRAARCR